MGMQYVWTQKDYVEESHLRTVFWREEGRRNLCASSFSSLFHWSKFSTQGIVFPHTPSHHAASFAATSKPDLMFCSEVLCLNLDVTGRAGDYERVADRPQKVGFYGSTQNVLAMAIAKTKQSQPGSKTQVSLREPVKANKMSTEKYNLGYSV